MLGDSAATSREGNLTDLGAIAEYNQQLMQAVQAAPAGQVDPEIAAAGAGLRGGAGIGLSAWGANWDHPGADRAKCAAAVAAVREGT